eukprot:2200105-Rhodomonas_salina.6
MLVETRKAHSFLSLSKRCVATCPSPYVTLGILHVLLIFIILLRHLSVLAPCAPRLFFKLLVPPSRQACQCSTIMMMTDDAQHSSRHLSPSH